MNSEILKNKIEEQYDFIESNYSYGYDTFKDFIKECNKTIEDYNNII